MCLAIPGRIIKIENADSAVIDYSGVTATASLRLVPEAKIGDMALVHAGFVIQLLDEEAGKELKELVDEIVGYADEG